jgi:hypothetical protein
MLGFLERSTPRVAVIVAVLWSVNFIALQDDLGVLGISFDTDASHQRSEYQDRR